jgi:hypothetical protein
MISVDQLYSQKLMKCLERAPLTSVDQLYSEILERASLTSAAHWQAPTWLCSGRLKMSKSYKRALGSKNLPFTR